MILELKLENKWLEATWYTEDNEVKSQVHCESFSGHPEHIAMIRTKASEYGTELDEAIIQELVDGFEAPTAAELAQQLEAAKPKLLTPKQARLALLGAGLYDTVNQAVKANPAHEIYWEYALEVKRDDALLLELATVMGLSSEQLDALFLAGSVL